MSVGWGVGKICGRWMEEVLSGYRVIGGIVDWGWEEFVVDVGWLGGEDLWILEGEIFWVYMFLGLFILFVVWN